MELNNNFGLNKKNRINLKDLLIQILSLYLITIANFVVFLYKNNTCPSIAAFIFRILYKFNVILQNFNTPDRQNNSVVLFSTPKIPGKKNLKSRFMENNLSPIADTSCTQWNNHNITGVSF
ncbi:Hypothetical protein SRAE_1000293200 [Strongyloides ratti]|uniref:Uncharacterized protein n=1 Tax=Strongyloides ratti TaxID=34506 RepID=A0A090MX22_STRRB|nr:Hypothetical protein SRAE_1000293200 [Strongyloides ratti]CEF64679.1 Hypothetical protein SRAE_1000293200 [Strongyloides ratti]